MVSINFSTFAIQSFIYSLTAYLDTDIGFIKGVGPAKADILLKELEVKTARDLVNIFPFRYIDKTQVQKIKDLKSEGETALLKGTIISVEKVKGKNNRSRLTALLKDESGFIELVWFQGVKWLEDSIQEGKEYIVYGRLNVYTGKKSIPHPEMEEYTEAFLTNKGLEPVYASTEKLDNLNLDSKGRRKIVKTIFEKLSDKDFPENLPDYIIQKFKLPSRYETFKWIHFPKDDHQILLAQNRIKFEEFFFLQLEMLMQKQVRKGKYVGPKFEIVGEKFNSFYKEKLPFELTNAQKRVIKEIRADMGHGFQMNRLLQGDVGSGKTIVALLVMLIALDNGYQTCMMAPTEILAQQHYESISSLLIGTGVRVAFLSGSVTAARKKETKSLLQQGLLDIVIGTHALIEEDVAFHQLGLVIIDEQHRFGVAQRASLWRKSKNYLPHILVMTATPIPRTLALTVYGDLDVSIIDELPVGRKEIKTIHKYESARPQVIAFMHAEIAKGRQIYVVFPLIEESENFDLKDLQAGYEMLLQYFPQPDYQISVVHGRMKAADKDFEMKRFVEKKTQIMVATTVIEVGVNVPNASVMVIENAERFGLSQMHQLRGRVGRGADQSYCLLMSGNKVSADAKKRLSTMVKTTNGFEIAAVDMELRGPGELSGTRQSGVTSFRMLNLSQDINIINAARTMAEEIVNEDPTLGNPNNVRLYNYLRYLAQQKRDWRDIS